MKIVRALWGEQKNVIDEVPKIATFGKDQIVYVWGKENYDYLLSLGYYCYLVNENVTEPKYSTSQLHFNHKLKAFKLAGEQYGEFLFLDWDMKILKGFDSTFFDLLRIKPVQMPLYNWPKDSYRTGNENVTPDLKLWLETQMEYLDKYSYPFHDTLVSCNAGFFYDSTGKMGDELLKISMEYKLESCIEEHAMFIYANCDMDEYIHKYEPYVTYGRPNNSKHLRLDINTQNILNIYIDRIIQKNIYLEHR